MYLFISSTYFFQCNNLLSIITLFCNFYKNILQENYQCNVKASCEITHLNRADCRYCFIKKCCKNDVKMVTGYNGKLLFTKNSCFLILEINVDNSQ